MSARKAVGSSLAPVGIHVRETSLSLQRESVFLNRNGIEFRSRIPFAPWKEMTLTIQSPFDGGKVHCSGVVVACSGNRHAGYHVSMLFTAVSRHSQAQLESMMATDV